MNWRVESVKREDVDAIEAVRELWTAYWTVLGLPPEFQGFGAELRELPGKYSPPTGRLFLVRVEGQPAATAAFRPLGREACEVKRFYVDPGHRRRGIAGALLTKLIEEARRCGYRTLYADTLPSMTSALKLYVKMGFIQVVSYSEDPTPDAIYLRLDLS